MYTFESSHPYWLLCSRHFNLLLAVKSPNEDGKILLSYFSLPLPKPIFSFLGNFYDQIDGVAMALHLLLC